MLEDQDKMFLLKLARNTIERLLLTGKTLKIDEANISSPVLLEKRGSFVTLHKESGALRGCIGKIYGEKKLYEDIIENTIAAASKDPRFPPLSPQEFSDINIEISILTQPEEIVYNTAEELLEKIAPHQDGLIFIRGRWASTFLPQVWKELPEKESFLSHLSQKAGFSPNAWREAGVKFFKYKVEKFKE